MVCGCCTTVRSSCCSLLWFCLSLKDGFIAGCVMMDSLCIAPGDVSSYEAIKALHARLDDDQSGDVDLFESVDVSAVWLYCGFGG